MVNYIIRRTKVACIIHTTEEVAVGRGGGW